MKKIMFGILVILILLCFTPIPAATATETSEVSLSSDELQILINECIDRKIEIENHIEKISAIPGVSHIQLALLNSKWMEFNDMQIEYEEKLKEIKEKEEQARWARKFEEHYNATYVWTYLKGCGYSDVMCAGIMGNFMAETGGQTLDIKWDDKTGGYYGMAQWNKNHIRVWNTSLHEQCEYLIRTIEAEFIVYGYKYQQGFNYISFCNLDSPADAALAFAKCYERCSSASYKQRMKNAQKAYDYFVN